MGRRLHGFDSQRSPRLVIQVNGSIEGMKTIKFRGRRKQSGKMEYGWGCFTDESEKLYIVNATYDGFEEVSELQQFTGLLDRNRKEIYEGDIVRDTAGSVTRIEFNSETAMFGEHHPTMDMWRQIGFDVEVIGNIYEPQSTDETVL